MPVRGDNAAYKVVINEKSECSRLFYNYVDYILHDPDQLNEFPFQRIPGEICVGPDIHFAQDAGTIRTNGGGT